MSDWINAGVDKETWDKFLADLTALNERYSSLAAEQVSNDIFDEVTFGGSAEQGEMAGASLLNRPEFNDRYQGSLSNREQLQAEFETDFQNLASQYGVQTQREDDGKIYYMDPGNPFSRVDGTVNPYDGAQFEWQPGSDTGGWIRDRRTDSYQINDFIGDAVPAGIGLVLTGALSGPLGGGFVGQGLASGLSSAATDLITTGSVDSGSVLTDALTGGLLQSGFEALPDNPVSPVFLANNFVGDFAQGTLNNAVGQYIEDGGVSGTDAFLAGAANVGAQMAADAILDTIQTDDINSMIARGETVDGRPIEDWVADAAAGDEYAQYLINNLPTSTDLRGLLGPSGFLTQAGIDTEFLQTGPLSTTINAAGGVLSQIPGVPQAVDFVGNVLNPYGAGFENRYDERFFDITAQRSSESPYSGIIIDPEGALRSGGNYLGGLFSGPDTGFLPSWGSSGGVEQSFDSGNYSSPVRENPEDGLLSRGGVTTNPSLSFNDPLGSSVVERVFNAPMSEGRRSPFSDLVGSTFSFAPARTPTENDTFSSGQVLLPSDSEELLPVERTEDLPSSLPGMGAAEAAWVRGGADPSTYPGRTDTLNEEDRLPSQQQEENTTGTSLAEGGGGVGGGTGDSDFKMDWYVPEFVPEIYGPLRFNTVDYTRGLLSL
jgi:hypothetical protein